MLNSIIAGSLKHRVLVLAASAILLVTGLFVIPGIPVDIFPDLTAPSVTVITETRGMAPEEVELLVTFPLESALNGASGVRRVRSVSAAGISVIWVEFEWGQDVYRARQVVAERVQGVTLPATVEAPELGPVSSIMGEITFIALTSSSPEIGPMELRHTAETTMRRALLAIPGISQVTPIGGDVREFHVQVNPQRLAQVGVTLDQVASALNDATRDPAAGFHIDQSQEYLVRGLGRARDTEDLAAAVIESRGGIPITVGSIANVHAGPEPKRGTASYRTQPAVILSVQKQPGANTLALTRVIDEAVERLGRTLPAGAKIEKENFRQADFIEVAIHNVTAALRDGAILVVAILFLFLGSVRTTLIMALAIPLSLVAGILTLAIFGVTINTMTLGGLTIAIGVLVDDAIIGIENVVRRLRLEHLKPQGERRKSLEVVFRATSEVRGAIFYATLIIGLVFVPLFLLPGMEGRLLRPLGLAYITALAASFLVSLTISPALCYMMLARSRVVETAEPWLLRKLKARYVRDLDSAIAHPSLLHS